MVIMKIKSKLMMMMMKLMFMIKEEVGMSNKTVITLMATIAVIAQYLTYVSEPRHDKMCLRKFPTKPDTNRPAQPQKLARVLKFRI